MLFGRRMFAVEAFASTTFTKRKYGQSQEDPGPDAGPYSRTASEFDGSGDAHHAQRHQREIGTSYPG